MDQGQKVQVAGVSFALLAYIAWGVLPLYWKLLESVPAAEILAHRIVWSFVFVIGILAIYGRWEDIKVTLSSRKNRLAMLVCSLLISGNWFTYIYAVNSNQLVEASFGYYISPLFSMFLAITILKERLNFWQGVALIFAATGVLIIAVQHGSIPWIALILTVSFGFYGLVKKMVKFDSMTGLATETAFVTPVALIYIIFLQQDGIGSFTFAFDSITLLLMGAGIATAMPLLWFAQAANRIKLSTISFIQYLAPTISLGIGIFLFREPFTLVHAVSFAFIWCALAIYSCSNTKAMLWLRERIIATIQIYKGQGKTASIEPVQTTITNIEEVKHD
ncbi:EamA family transporter RarD [Desulfuribacillus alkaliarsenatis]|uniref:Transporter n=1 Tax=Desulfuribacillus alkaliarsenatis TaxID=766136 RepID=A0A1E5G3E8_9FIRM|nr:EamA family transporter RarD [Desulfuribacillus alkaliarsenatis]OEF97583.1 transporter [Desulfuribacillus alkaliarsenatis]